MSVNTFENNWKSPEFRRHVLHITLQAARKGREVLLSYFGNLANIEEKFQAGLVSEADKESEKAIQHHLRQYFPDVDFLGEESAFENKLQAYSSSGKPLWIVDPLDGTTNYVHRFPVFCISIGLEIMGEIQLGVIDLPILNETYTAIKGEGAFVNGKKLQVSKSRELKSSLLATGFIADDEAALEEQIKIFSKLVRCTRGIRRPGAAAYDLCMVASGVFDAYWEKNLKPWDSAAGILLVREAGGVVLNYSGENYKVSDNSLIAANQFLSSPILDVLTKL